MGARPNPEEKIRILGLSLLTAAAAVLLSFSTARQRTPKPTLPNLDAMRAAGF